MKTVVLVALTHQTLTIEVAHQKPLMSHFGKLIWVIFKSTDKEYMLSFSYEDLQYVGVITL